MILTQRIDAPASQEHVGKDVHIDVHVRTEFCGQLPVALLQHTLISYTSEVARTSQQS